MNSDSLAATDSLVEAGAPGRYQIELTPDAATQKLAVFLHETLERYDPSDDSDWGALSDHQKEIFRATVAALLTKRVWVARAMES
jgi:hypothetical protein